MARGRVPRDVLSRPRDTVKRQKEIAEVVDTGELAGPDLPEGIGPDREPWHRRTAALWDSLRRYPPMKDEPALSWEYALDTMVLHHRMWQHSEWQHASEVRLRLAKFACTPEDRQRMKLRITTPATPAESSGSQVADLSARRARLTDS